MAHGRRAEPDEPDKPADGSIPGLAYFPLVRATTGVVNLARSLESMVRGLTFRLWLLTLCCLGACSYPDFSFVPEASDATSCSDRVQNHDESDVDCGGKACAPCVTGQSCVVPNDCSSGVCHAESCAAPSCDDGVKNGPRVSGGLRRKLLTDSLPERRSLPAQRRLPELRLRGPALQRGHV